MIPTTKIETTKISLQEAVGHGYATFWKFKGVEAVIMGGKGSKKSKTIALRWMYLLEKYPLACLLVTRNVADTLRDSAYADLKWACERLELKDWDFKVSPLEAVNKRTKQKIYFRGLDDWQKLASITVSRKGLCLPFWWAEEAFEIDDPKTVDKVSMSIRGKLPEGYFRQQVFSFNPWEDGHHMVKRLTDHLTPDRKLLEEFGKQEKIVKTTEKIIMPRTRKEVEVEVEKLFMITNYQINEFLSPMDIALYTKMRDEDDTRYRTEGLGMPGVEPGNIFIEEWFENLYEDVPRLSWKCISVDATFKKTSKTKGRETDFVAIQVWGLDEDRNFVLTGRRKKHLSFIETCEEIDELVKLNPDINAILIEDKANGSAIIEVMRKKYPFVIAVEPKGGKVSRAEAIAPCFESGKVKLPDRNWLKEYKAEFIAFPNGDHDDEVDATSQALMRLMNIATRKYSKEEKEKIEQADMEYNNILKDMGLNDATTEAVNALCQW